MTLVLLLAGLEALAVVAWGKSAPEVAVNLKASLAGQPDDSRIDILLHSPKRLKSAFP
jgi:hypothetical protein